MARGLSGPENDIQAFPQCISLVLYSVLRLSRETWVIQWKNNIGWTLAKFIQLRRNKSFDNFIMLVWVQGSLFHIAAGSHPVQEAGGSQDNLYRCQIQKLLQYCWEPYQQIPLVITIDDLHISHNASGMGANIRVLLIRNSSSHSSLDVNGLELPCLAATMCFTRLRNPW